MLCFSAEPHQNASPEYKGHRSEKFFVPGSTLSAFAFDVILPEGEILTKIEIRVRPDALVAQARLNFTSKFQSIIISNDFKPYKPLLEKLQCVVSAKVGGCSHWLGYWTAADIKELKRTDPDVELPWNQGIKPIWEDLIRRTGESWMASMDKTGPHPSPGGPLPPPAPSSAPPPTSTNLTPSAVESASPNSGTS